MSRLTLFTSALAAACLLCVYVRLPSVWALAAGVAFALAGFLMGVWRGRWGWRRTLRWLCLGLGVGLCWFAGFAALVRTPVQQLEYETIPLVGRVADWPRQTDYGVSVEVRGGPREGRKTRLLLYLDGEFASLRPGDTISCVAYCKPSSVMQGTYSPRYPAMGIQLLATAQGKVTVRPSEKPALRDLPALAAGKVREKIDQLYPPDIAAFLRALLTGDQSQLDDEIKNAFSRTGLSHVVSVSGLHVSFLAGFLALFMKGRSKVSVCAQIATIFFFAAMAGSAPGSIRAAILWSAGLVAPLLGREKDLETALAAALLVMLLWNPWAVASAGLQFSFAATLGIYRFGLPLHQKLRKSIPVGPLRRPADVLAGVLAIGLGAMLVTAPLSALYFQQTSLIAPLSNLVTQWAVSLAFLGGIGSVLAAAIWLPLGAGLADLVAGPAGYFLACARALNRLPFAGLSMGSDYYVWWVAFAYGMALLAILWRKKMRPVLPVCACVITLCLSMVLTSLTAKAGDLRVSVLDVGQGQSVALCSGEYTALIDCGGTKDPGAVAASYFHSLGKDRVDLLVLTHFHDDHANGVTELLNRLEVAALVIPNVDPDNPLRLEITRQAAVSGTEIRYMETLCRIPFGEGELTLYPPPSEKQGGNEACLAVMASSGEWDALVTGDMDQSGEIALLNRWPVPDIELLVAGHHGSRYATGAPFLRRVKPEWAVLSVGYNHYGHPAPETLDRLRQAGAAVYRTDQMGSVTIRAGS